jgi:AcrR family transcriptional regulator
LAYGVGPARARRARTRLSAQDRREQILAVARRIAAHEGVHAVTNKRVAREAGISEAQAHNCFSRRDDILVELARREVAAMNAVRESEVERGHDNQTRVTLSTVAYLRQVSERGALIQALLNLPAVREGLRAERASRTAFSRERMTDRLNGRYGVDRDLAYGATTVLTAVCLRAGRLLAEGRIDLDLAERLSLALVTAGNRRVTRLAREAAKAEATPPAA